MDPHLFGSLVRIRIEIKSCIRIPALKQCGSNNTGANGALFELRVNFKERGEAREYRVQIS
jgi:hypothetical protein